METITCPRCGTENTSSAMNCIQCRINLKFALEHSEASTEATKNDLNFFESPHSTQQAASKVNQITVIGIGLLVGFIGTAFNLRLFFGGGWFSIEFLLELGAIGSIFGMIGSVIGYKLSKSIHGVWIEAIIGTVVLPGGCFVFWPGM